MKSSVLKIVYRSFTSLLSRLGILVEFYSIRYICNRYWGFFHRYSVFYLYRISTDKYWWEQLPIPIKADISCYRYDIHASVQKSNMSCNHYKSWRPLHVLQFHLQSRQEQTPWILLFISKITRFLLVGFTIINFNTNQNKKSGLKMDDSQVFIFISMHFCFVALRFRSGLLMPFVWSYHHFKIHVFGRSMNNLERNQRPNRMSLNVLPWRATVDWFIIATVNKRSQNLLWALIHKIFLQANCLWFKFANFSRHNFFLSYSTCRTFHFPPTHVTWLAWLV